MQQDTADYIERPVRQLFQYLCSQKVKKTLDVDDAMSYM